MPNLLLENDVLRVQLDARTGGFLSIHDKLDKYEYLHCPDRTLLFRLMVPEAEEHFRHLDSAAPEVEISKDTAILKYHIEGIEAVVSLRLEGGAIDAQLEIINSSGLTIEEVMFPWVRGIAPIPSGELILPCFWRRKFEDVFGKDLGGDHITWNEWTQKFVARYPAYLTTAWCDYGNRDHGIALEGRHRDFSILDLFVHKVVEKTLDPVRRSLDLCAVYPRRVKPGETYSAPPSRIFVHQGDWHVVADAHREWTETWLKNPARPAKFAESIGWHFYFMKHQDGLVLGKYSDLPAMARASLDAGCPYLLLFGWQTGGHDNNYFYRYFANESWGGASALRAAIDECRAMGAELMPFFNGTLANVEMPEHKEFGHRWEAKTRTGHSYYAGDWARHNFDALTRNRAMLHTEIAFCKEQRVYFLEIVRRMVQEYGFGNLQLDQISEKMFVDYAEDHIETTPDRVFVDGLRELLEKTRRIIREAHPDGVMISEALNEYTGQWCDSSWDWNILLPFPEPILYSLPWLMASHEIDALEYGEANKAFAYKMHFDMKIDGGDAPITKYPDFARHVKSLAELKRRSTGCYVYADFRDREGIEYEAPDGVLVKVYKNRATQEAGIVIAETDGKPATTAVSLKQAFQKPFNALDSNQRPLEEIISGSTYKIELRPHEVRVLKGA